MLNFTTQNQINLSNCDSRIRGVEAQILYSSEITEETGGAEVKRLEAARKAILSGMTEEEIVEYDAMVEAARLAEIKNSDERATDVARMNQNKDRPSH